MKHTKKQITESIVHWSAYMLENKMVDEAELKDLIGEGLLKRAIGAVKRTFGKAKDAVVDATLTTKEALHDLLLPNKGVKQMLDAMASIVAKGDDLKKAKIYATLGSAVYPVVDFALKSKKTLMLLVNRSDTGAMPKTLDGLRMFFHNELGEAKPKDAIESIYCAEVAKVIFESEDVLNESKLTDFIQKNKLSKEDALKPDNLKQMSKLSKQSGEKTKAAIEKYFASSSTSKKLDAKKPDAKKAQSEVKPKSTSSKTSQIEKKETSIEKKTEEKKDEKKEDLKKKKTLEPETKSSDSSEPMKKDVHASASEFKKDDVTLKIFDNKLLDVKVDKGNIGFVFSKSKQEIALDKQLKDMFTV